MEKHRQIARLLAWQTVGRILHQEIEPNPDRKEFPEYLVGEHVSDNSGSYFVLWDERDPNGTYIQFSGDGVEVQDRR